MKMNFIQVKDEYRSAYCFLKKQLKQNETLKQLTKRSFFVYTLDSDQDYGNDILNEYLTPAQAVIRSLRYQTLLIGNEEERERLEPLTLTLFFVLSTNRATCDNLLRLLSICDMQQAEDAKHNTYEVISTQDVLDTDLEKR